MNLEKLYETQNIDSLALKERRRKAANLIKKERFLINIRKKRLKNTQSIQLKKMRKLKKKKCYT